MHVHVGCRIVYESVIPTPMMFVVRPPHIYQHRLLEEQQAICPCMPVHEYIDGFGNQSWFTPLIRSSQSPP